MEKYNIFLHYLNKVFSYIVLAVGIVGLIIGIKSDENIGGGGLGILIVGIWTITDYFKIPQANAGDIMMGFVTSLLILSGLNLISREKIYYKILGFLISGVGLLYLCNLIFGWGY